MSEEQKSEDILIVSAASPAAGAIWSGIHQGQEMIRIEPNGDFYVRGKLAGTDREVFHGFAMYMGLCKNVSAEENQTLRSANEKLQKQLEQAYACIRELQRLALARNLKEG
jgi:hypothetical protein